MTDKIPRFIEVDNAGQIFIPIHSKKEPTLSRIELTLYENVDKILLQNALEIIIHRFPYFQVYLKRTFFKWVFERTSDIPRIEQESHWTNGYIDFFNNNFLFRVTYRKNKVGIELSHILSDGYGTMNFLLALIVQYFKLKGVAFMKEDLSNIMTVDDKIDNDEMLCAYRKIFSPKGPNPGFYSRAYIPKGEIIHENKYFYTTISMDLERIKEISSNHSTNLNTFLVSIYTCAIQSIYFEDKKNGKLKRSLPIRLQIPVNLRRMYPSKSLKNFSYVYSPEFNPEKKKLSLDDMIIFITNWIQHEKITNSIENQISRNLRLENTIWFKYAPLFIKDFLFSFFYQIFSQNTYSGILTNLGAIKLPQLLQSRIESFMILPTISHSIGRLSALYSYKGKLEMNIGSSVNDLRLENAVTEILTELNIKHEVIYKRDT